MPASSSKSAALWVAMAVLTQPHGVSGRVKVKSFTEPADDFAKHALTDESGKPYKLRITGHTQGQAIVEIEGVTKREQVELLRGVKLGVAREALPEIADANRYYIADLVGMEVAEESGAFFGTVQAVSNYGASDILEITRPGGKSELFAFTQATFPEIDAKARRITISPPEILDAEDRGESA